MVVVVYKDPRAGLYWYIRTSAPKMPCKHRGMNPVTQYSLQSDLRTKCQRSKSLEFSSSVIQTCICLLAQLERNRHERIGVRTVRTENLEETPAHFAFLSSTNGHLHLLSPDHSKGLEKIRKSIGVSLWGFSFFVLVLLCKMLHVFSIDPNKQTASQKVTVSLAFSADFDLWSSLIH